MKGTKWEIKKKQYKKKAKKVKKGKWVVKKLTGEEAQKYLAKRTGC